MFDPVDDLTRNNVVWFLMGDFLRLSESYAQDIEIIFGD